MRCKEAKWLAEEALQIAEKRRKGKIYSTECRVSENSKEIRKLSKVNNVKK